MTVLGATDPLVGHALDGRYEVVQRIARGGMATVYRARDRRLGRVVAVKVMHEGLGDDAEFTRKFDREARASARLVHPNVVAVFDQGHDAGRPYIVMELAEGTTLRHLIAREAPLPPLRALELMEPVLDALAHAHDSGLVHRDVKPENVLITDRGTVKVADFGLSRAITGQSASATQGLLIGTVSYLPPELVTSGRASFRSDVYSAGVVLFELLTGQKPYQGETPIQVAYAHVHNDMPAPSTLLVNNNPLSQDSRRIIPPYLDALVQACTRRRPSDRPRDAREMLNRLRIAKEALTHGILDDPELTRQMFPERVDESESLGTSLTTPDTNDDSSHEASDEITDAPQHCTRVLPRSPRTPLQLDPSPVYRRRRGIVAIVAMLLVTGMILGGIAWWNTVGSWVTVPTLSGVPSDQAIASARANHLTLEVTEAYSETVEKGDVISTTPGTGERVKRNTAVQAVVSKGPERYPVPTLIGVSLDDATSALTEAHLTLGKVTNQYSETISKGIVLAASLDAGTPAKPQTAVDLTVSAGPQPIPVPSVTGKTSADAQAAIEKLGLVVSSSQANSDTVPKGTVISQKPTSGTLTRGETVTIVVSKGPVMVTMPTIPIGTSEEEAIEKVKAAGLVPKVTYGSPEWLRAGIVSLTDPKGGTQVAKGSTVTLFVV